MKTMASLATLAILLILAACQSSTTQKDSSKGRFNLQKDAQDHADQWYVPASTSPPLAAKVDLRQIPNAFPPVFDQGKINSCTANAVAAAIYFDMVQQNWRKPFVPSRLFIYYNERALANDLDEQRYGARGAPVSLRNCIKSVHEQGYCEERLWPYDTEKLYQQPPAEAFDSARLHHTYEYRRIDHKINLLKDCLSDGFPFLLGIPVYPSFETAQVIQDGQVPMPQADEKQIGGHAILVVGYDEEQQHFIFRNSLGSGWGADGYGYLNYEYVLKYGFDFWVLKKVL
ncbi:MAG: C1 family peptidase [Bacteroidota bacterium]